MSRTVAVSSDSNQDPLVDVKTTTKDITHTTVLNGGADADRNEDSKEVGGYTDINERRQS